MRTLYIVGNGFDLFHRLDTRYCSFGFFLKKNYAGLYDQLMEYIGLPDVGNDSQGILDDILWKEFEQTLSHLNPETVYEAYSESLANPGSIDFRDRDWNTFAIDMEHVVENLTAKLFRAFNEFILNVSYPILGKDVLIRMDDTASYLSFNYTNTLEHYYNIPEDKILYIHGKANQANRDLILGHGIDPESFKEKDPKPSSNLTPEELEMWREEMANQFDWSFELGKEKLYDYFLKTFKLTNAVISDNTAFFKNVENVESIFILGHSLSSVDMPYFEKMVSSIKGEPVFTVSFYNDREKPSHKSTLKSLGIKETKIHLVRMDELK
jgi:hypothetical protein